MCGGWEEVLRALTCTNSLAHRGLVFGRKRCRHPASVDFSSDSTQIAVGMYWYQTDGNTAYVYQVDTGTQVDSVSGPRPATVSLETTTIAVVIYGIS